MAKRTADLFDDQEPVVQEDDGQLAWEFELKAPASYAPPTKKDMSHLREQFYWQMMQRGQYRIADECLKEVSRLNGLYAPSKVEVTRDPLEQVMDEIAARTPQGGLSDLVTH